LSSISVSLRSKSSQAIGISEKQEDEGPVLPVRSKADEISQSSSSRLLASQTISDPLRVADLCLPTPAQTPSLHFHGSIHSLHESTEDAAISRLRQYAVSIQCVQSLRPVKSALLSHWPSSPGVDPVQYSWEAKRDAPAANKQLESGGEKDFLSRREARRHRKTERFLRRERASAAEAASQPVLSPFGSQPEVAHHSISSQIVDDLPMTQPDRGAFGSRSGLQSTKKQKRRRAAGF